MFVPVHRLRSATRIGLFTFSALALLGGCFAPQGAGEDRALDGGVRLQETQQAQTTEAGCANGMPSRCCQYARIGGYKVWAHFNSPVHVPADGSNLPQTPCVPSTSSPSLDRDLNIRTEIIRLINSAPGGSTIRGHLYSVTDTLLLTALESAVSKNPPVNVLLSADSDLYEAYESGSAVAVRLHNLAGGAATKYCPAGKGCIASVAGRDSNAHTKAFTFSGATTPDGTPATNVVWVSSSNMTYGNDGMGGFNNSVTIYGDPVLYSGMYNYLLTMRKATPNTDDYYQPDMPQGYIQAAAADVYMSPEKQTDLIENRLDDILTSPIQVTPTTTRRRYTTGQCEVLVANAWMKSNRPDVIAQLIAMHNAGCLVRIITNVIEPDPITDADHLDPCAVRELIAAGITDIRTYAPFHDKVILVHGIVPSDDVSPAYWDKYRVFTGSHNIEKGTNYENDEILVKMGTEWASDKPLYDAFKVHFEDAFKAGTPVPATTACTKRVTAVTTGSTNSYLGLSISGGGVRSTVQGGVTKTFRYPVNTAMTASVYGAFTSCPPNATATGVWYPATCTFTLTKDMTVGAWVGY